MLLGRLPPGEQMNVEAIAQQLGGLSRNHLHKIVQDLAALGVLRTIRGAGGGVTLGAPLDEVRLGALIRSLEGEQPLVECFRADGGCCTLEPGCKLRRSLREAREAFYRSLDARTLADCVGGAGRVQARATPHAKARSALRVRKPPATTRTRGRRVGRGRRSKRFRVSAGRRASPILARRPIAARAVRQEAG